MASQGYNAVKSVFDTDKEMAKELNRINGTTLPENSGVISHLSYLKTLPNADTSKQLVEGLFGERYVELDEYDCYPDAEAIINAAVDRDGKTPAWIAIIDAKEPITNVISYSGAADGYLLSDGTWYNTNTVPSHTWDTSQDIAVDNTHENAKTNKVRWIIGYLTDVATNKNIYLYKQYTDHEIYIFYIRRGKWGSFRISDDNALYTRHLCQYIYVHDDVTFFKFGVSDALYKTVIDFIRLPASFSPDSSSTTPFYKECYVKSICFHPNTPVLQSRLLYKYGIQSGYVNIPSGVTIINEYDLGDIIAASNVKAIVFYGTNIVSFGGYTINGIYGLENLVLPEGLQSISGTSLSSNKNLKYVKMSSTLIATSGTVLSSNPVLKEVDFSTCAGLLAANMGEILSKCPCLEILKVPNGYDFISKIDLADLPALNYQTLYDLAFKSKDFTGETAPVITFNNAVEPAMTQAILDEFANKNITLSFV